MRIARPPNEMGAKRNGGQIGTVRGKNELFGHRFRARIVGFKAIGIRQRFVAPFNIATAVDDARRTRVHEFLNPGGPSSCNHIRRTGLIRRNEIRRATPHSRLGGHVVHDFAPNHRPFERSPIAEIAERLFDADLRKPWIVRTRKRTDGIAACDEPPHDGPAEEPAATRDESLHAGPPFHFGPSFLSAQTASFSRKIFELWRTSVGNP